MILGDDRTTRPNILIDHRVGATPSVLPTKIAGVLKHMKHVPPHMQPAMLMQMFQPGGMVMPPNAPDAFHHSRSSSSLSRSASMDDIGLKLLDTAAHVPHQNHALANPVSPVPGAFAIGAAHGLFATNHASHTPAPPTAADALTDVSPADVTILATEHDAEDDPITKMEKEFELATAAKAAAKAATTKAAKASGAPPAAPKTKASLLSKLAVPKGGGIAPGKAAGGAPSKPKGPPVKVAPLKRPAASTVEWNELKRKVSMNDVFSALGKLKRADITRGAFTSRASDTAKRRALSIGADREVALEFARVHYGTACAMYDKLK